VTQFKHVGNTIVAYGMTHTMNSFSEFLLVKDLEYDYLSVSSHVF